MAYLQANVRIEANIFWRQFKIHLHQNLFLIFLHYYYCWNWQITVILLSLNKANLRDLIAATGLVILLKLDLNRRFFSPCDLEISWMTPKNNRAPLLCYFKLFASFRSHWWIQTGVTVRKRLIWVNIDAFLSRDLEIWWMTLKNNRAPLLCYFKLCAAFRSHWWIQTGVRVRKRPIWVKFDAF